MTANEKAARELLRVCQDRFTNHKVIMGPSRTVIKILANDTICAWIDVETKGGGAHIDYLEVGTILRAYATNIQESEQ